MSDMKGDTPEIKKDTKFQQLVKAYRTGGRDYVVLDLFLKIRDAHFQRLNVQEGITLYNFLESMDERKSKEFYDAVDTELEETLKPELQRMVQESERRHAEHYFSISRLDRI